jgi:hypothetical protein
MDPNFIQDPSTCPLNGLGLCASDAYQSPMPVTCDNTWTDANGCCSTVTKTTQGTNPGQWSMTAASQADRLKTCTWTQLDVEWYDTQGICTYTYTTKIYGLDPCANCSCFMIGANDDLLTCDPAKQPPGYPKSTTYSAGASCGTNPNTGADITWSATTTCFACY